MDVPGATIVVAAISTLGSVFVAWMVQRNHAQTKQATENTVKLGIEFLPNGGGSLRDVVDRIERSLEGVGEFIIYQHGKNHDLANELTVVKGHLDLLRREATPPLEESVQERTTN